MREVALRERLDGWNREFFSVKNSRVRRIIPNTLVFALLQTSEEEDDDDDEKPKEAPKDEL